MELAPLGSFGNVEVIEVVVWHNVNMCYVIMLSFHLVQFEHIHQEPKVQRELGVQPKNQVDLDAVVDSAHGGNDPQALEVNYSKIS